MSLPSSVTRATGLPSLKVAWFSYFPIEWLEGAPPEVRALPKRHPAPWQQSCVGELSKIPGLELHVLALDKRITKDLTFDVGPVTYHVLRAPGGLRAPSCFWLDTYLISKRLRKIQPQVVHAWGTEMGAALVATRLRYPSLISIQGLMEYYRQASGISKYERVIERFERWSLRRARVVSGESTFVVEWLRRRYPHLQLHHVEHSPTWDFWRVERRPQTQPMRFLCVAGMSYRKGSDLLLKALDRLRKDIDFTLTLVQVAPNREMIATLQRETSTAIWERVRFVHAAGPREVAEELSLAGMVLFPTRADTGPVAVKEAVAAGVPVVGSNVGGLRDYVRQGKNGILFPSGDLDAFVAAIREASSNPMLGKGMVDPEVLGQVREHLSPSQMAQGFVRIYRALAEKS